MKNSFSSYWDGAKPATRGCSNENILYMLFLMNRAPLKKILFSGALFMEFAAKLL